MGGEGLTDAPKHHEGLKVFVIGKVFGVHRRFLYSHLLLRDSKFAKYAKFLKLRPEIEIKLQFIGHRALGAMS